MTICADTSGSYTLSANEFDSSGNPTGWANITPLVGPTGYNFDLAIAFLTGSSSQWSYKLYPLVNGQQQQPASSSIAANPATTVPPHYGKSVQIPLADSSGICGTINVSSPALIAAESTGLMWVTGTLSVTIGTSNPDPNTSPTVVIVPGTTSGCCGQVNRLAARNIAGRRSRSKNFTLSLADKQKERPEEPKPPTSPNRTIFFL